MKKFINKIKNKLKKWILSLFTAVFRLSFLVAVCFLVQGVRAIHQIFFPKVRAVVNETTKKDDWQLIRFEKENYIVFEGWFWGKKEIINHANSSGGVLLRIKDSKGKIITDNLYVAEGRSTAISTLKNNEKYFVEMKDFSEQYVITFS